MSTFTKIAIVIAGLLLSPLIAYAVQISVPSAPGPGYFLVSTSTGAYIATSSPQIPTAIPGGASSTVQYNANGLFAGNTGFVYNGTNLGIGVTNPTAQLHIVGTTPPAVTTSVGTNGQDVVTIMGAPGGSTSNSGSFAQGGKGANINIQSGTGGSVTGTPTTGIGGAGADVNIQAGTGGAGTTFGGTGGGVTIAGGQNGFGTSPGAPGFVALKGGNSTFGNQNGADVYLVGGLPTGTGVRGNIYLNLSPSFTIGGNTGIGISSAPLSRLDVGGNAAIGSYAATNAAPANGLVVSGNVGIGTSTPTSTLTVHGTIAADNMGGTYNFSYIGDRQFNTAPLATTNTTDFFVVSTTSSNAKRAFAVTSVLSGGTGGNVSNQGFNAAAVASSTVLGNLTGAGQGGNLRNRMTVTNGLSGFNVNTMSVVSGQAVTSGTLASTTNAIVYNAEAPNVAAGAFETNHFGFMNNGGVVTGGVNNVGNNYGFFSQNLGVGLNQAAFGTAENASTTCEACNYAFSSTGTARSYFAANVGIGSTTPQAALTIVAASSTVPTTAYTGLVSIIAGLENTTVKLFQEIDQWGHLITSGDSPSVSGGTSSVSGNDNNGAITVTGTLLTSVTLTFAHPWVTTPDCQESDNSTAVTADISSISTTQVVFGFSAGLNTGTVWYSCKGHQ